MEGFPGFFLSKIETKAMREMLESNLRQDGRAALETREISFDKTEEATVLKLGKTIVSCKIVKTQVLADEDHPNQGFFSVGLSSAQKLDPNFRSETLNAIRDMIKKNNALDVESLVITMGKLVWDIRAELVILENDGGLFEAMTLAVTIALLYTKLPGPRGPKPIVMHHLPIPTTFAFIGKDVMIVDPTVVEASACDGFMSIFANAQSEICCIRKSGGVPISSIVMGNCINIALDNTKKWHKSIMDQMGDFAPPLLKALTEKKREEEVPVIPIDDEEETKKKIVEAIEKADEEPEEGPADIEGLIAFVE